MEPYHQKENENIADPIIKILILTTRVCGEVAKESSNIAPRIISTFLKC